MSLYYYSACLAVSGRMAAGFSLRQLSVYNTACHYLPRRGGLLRNTAPTLRFNSIRFCSFADDHSKLDSAPPPPGAAPPPAHRVRAGMTVREALQESVALLEEAAIDESIASVTNILSVVLGLPWETGFRELQSIYERQQGGLAEKQLTQAQASDFASKLERRLQHEPIQYLTEKWDFLDYTLQIRPPLLCPRPETEELVQLVLDHIPIPARRSDTKRRILDIGCGTGCIGIALAHQIPHASITAIDIEPIAVETSKKNALAILGSEDVHRYHVDLCSAQDFIPPSLFDIVVGNPPYIPQSDLPKLDRNVQEYESPSALSDGTSEDGMDIIRVIVQKLPDWCKPGATCWMEVDPSQPALLKKWLDNSIDQQVKFVKTHQDIFGRDRFVQLQVQHEVALE